MSVSYVARQAGIAPTNHKFVMAVTATRTVCAYTFIVRAHVDFTITFTPNTRKKSYALCYFRLPYWAYPQLRASPPIRRVLGVPKRMQRCECRAAAGGSAPPSPRSKSPMIRKPASPRPTSATSIRASAIGRLSVCKSLSGSGRKAQTSGRDGFIVPKTARPMTSMSCSKMLARSGFRAAYLACANRQFGGAKVEDPAADMDIYSSSLGLTYWHRR